jgi:hypothetical protein
MRHSIAEAHPVLLHQLRSRLSRSRSPGCGHPDDIAARQQRGRGRYVVLRAHGGRGGWTREVGTPRVQRHPTPERRPEAVDHPADLAGGWTATSGRVNAAAALVSSPTTSVRLSAGNIAGAARISGIARGRVSYPSNVKRCVQGQAEAGVQVWGRPRCPRAKRLRPVRVEARNPSDLAGRVWLRLGWALSLAAGIQCSGEGETRGARLQGQKDQHLLSPGHILVFNRQIPALGRTPLIRENRSLRR